MKFFKNWLLVADIYLKADKSCRWNESAKGKKWKSSLCKAQSPLKREKKSFM